MLKNVVDQTATLQQSLFLQARTANSFWTMTSNSFWNARKTDKLLAGPDMARYVKDATSKGEMAAELTVFELHPMLHVNRTNVSQLLGWYLGCCAMENPFFSFYDAAKVEFDGIDPATDIPRDSSVERMFLSQPPVRDITFDLKCHCIGCGGQLTSTCPHTDSDGLTPDQGVFIHNNTGITFGQLRDRVQRALPRYPKATLEHLMFDGGFPVTTKEKQEIEATGALSWEHNFILCRNC
jgi:hypothetical protein